jgi:RluA family pseudouridine synthase
MHPILSIAAYRFVPLAALKQRRTQLLALCRGWNLHGSIVLSPEGIHLALAGEAPQVDLLLAELRSWPGLEGLQPRLSGAQQPPFQRMSVRIKQELVTLGVAGIEPARHTSPRLMPRELEHWLATAQPLTLLDVRNDYEVRLGTFKNAVHTGIGQFREFPTAIDELNCGREQPLVVFCTDGLRCEKAAPLLERAGFRQVWQLDGGLRHYFEQCGTAHYEGECFSFDARAGLDPNLPPVRWVQCENCRTPLSTTDQAHEYYRPGVACPYCLEIPAEHMAATLARRQARVHELIVPLPGSQPRDHFRPVHMPAHCDGLTLLEAMCRVVPHIPAATWRERCELGYLINDRDEPCPPRQIVRGGERYRHKFPALREPDVNMQIELLYEDEALLVLNKPAPLPMHASGRFYRNTLKHVLDALYHPQQPRPAHRLDANTTGVLIAARTQYIAGKLQTQFARGEVQKLYWVRVRGHPSTDEFECAAPISTAAGELGSRTVVTSGGLPSLTLFKVLGRDSTSTLLEARPLTGRTNQIRVHLWHLGMPVLGDPAYLDGGLLGDSQTLPTDAPPLCLHAWRISFQHPLQRKRVTFTAPEPAWVGKGTKHESSG